MMIPSAFFSNKVMKSSDSLYETGVVAKEIIYKNEVVTVRMGPIVHISQVAELTQKVGDYNYQISDEYFMSVEDLSNKHSCALPLNHSCSANVGVFGQICIVAMRDILPGEEVTLDYATIEARDDYQFACECLSKNCRKIIRGTDWKRPELQKCYDKYFSHFIQQKIDNFKYIH